MILPNGIEIKNQREMYSFLEEEYTEKSAENKREESILYACLCSYYGKKGKTADYVTEEVVDDFLRRHGVLRRKREKKRLQEEASGKRKDSQDRKDREAEEKKREEAEKKRAAIEQKEKKNIDDIELLNTLVRNLGGSAEVGVAGDDVGRVSTGRKVTEEEIDRMDDLYQGIYAMKLSSCFIPLRIDPKTGAGVYLIGTDRMSDSVQRIVGGSIDPENRDQCYACVLYHTLADLQEFMLDEDNASKKYELSDKAPEYDNILETRIKVFQTVEQAMREFENTVKNGYFTDCYAKYNKKFITETQLENVRREKSFTEYRAYFEERKSKGIGKLQKASGKPQNMFANKKVLNKEAVLQRAKMIK